MSSTDFLSGAVAPVERWRDPSPAVSTWQAEVFVVEWQVAPDAPPEPPPSSEWRARAEEVALSLDR